MINFFKKHKLKIITSLFCAFALSVFTILSFGCKTYAFTINDDGNLVGENLFDGVLVNGYHSGRTGTLAREDGRFVTNENLISLSSSQTYTISFSTISSNIYLDGICYYYQNGTFKNYEQLNNQTSPFTFTTTYEEYYISFNFISINNISYTQIRNVMINIGDTAKEWEPYGVWYSQQNYNDMINYYNDLLGNNPNVLYNALYGQELLLVDSNNYDRVFARDIMQPSADVKTFNEISTPNINDYLNNFSNDDTTTYPTAYFAYIVNFNYQITNPLMFEYNNTVLDVNFIFKNTIANNQISEQRDNTYPYFSVQNKEKFAYNQLIYDGIYMPDYGTFNFNLSIDGVAYANGYQDGINSQQTNISILRNDIISLNNKINELNNTINTLKALNDDLQQHSDVGWQSLFFAMADTPIRVVSNVLGFELFGLNLFSTFIGMLTVFAIVWLLKKFI